MSNFVKNISALELQKKNTGALMKRRLELLQCEESFAESDRFEHEVYEPIDGLIQYKNTPEWERAYNDVRAVLSQREHYPNKAERKKARQAKARRRK